MLLPKFPARRRNPNPLIRILPLPVSCIPDWLLVLKGVCASGLKGGMQGDVAGEGVRIVAQFSWKNHVCRVVSSWAWSYSCGVGQGCGNRAADIPTGKESAGELRPLTGLRGDIMDTTATTDITTAATTPDTTTTT